MWCAHTRKGVAGHFHSRSKCSSAVALTVDISNASGQSTLVPRRLVVVQGGVARQNLFAPLPRQKFPDGSPRKAGTIRKPSQPILPFPHLLPDQSSAALGISESRWVLPLPRSEDTNWRFQFGLLTDRAVSGNSAATRTTPNGRATPTHLARRFSGPRDGNQESTLVRKMRPTPSGTPKPTRRTSGSS